MFSLFPNSRFDSSGSEFLISPTLVFRGWWPLKTSFLFMSGGKGLKGGINSLGEDYLDSGSYGK